MTLRTLKEKKMTKQEYEKIISIIENNMTVSHDTPYTPRIVLTQLGFNKVKNELKEMVQDNG